MIPDADLAHELFRRARVYVEDAGLHAEVEWQRNVNVGELSEVQLLSETAWVILCSGFREKTVRKAFDHISLCFFDWESADLVRDHGEICVRAAMDSFRNEAKLRAIVKSAEIVSAVGFDELKYRLLQDPIGELRGFPFIGPVTVWHLAKNLGFDVAKPDRHLVRLAAFCGYPSVRALCEGLAWDCGEAIRVVDLILWRYLADNPGELSVSIQANALS